MTLSFNSCRDCKLCKVQKKEKSIGISGVQAEKELKPRIMIIQDTPARYEQICGEILVGDTVNKLNYLLNSAGIDYKNVYFTSAVKCRPKEANDINKTILKACYENLRDEIAEVEPELIITMGRYSLEILLNYNSLKEFRGHFLDFNTKVYYQGFGGKEKSADFKCKVMPTWGLESSMSKWEYDEDIIRDFKKALNYFNTNKIPKTPEPKVNTILTVNGLNDFVQRYREYNYATTDFETTGFDFWRHKIINAGYCGEKDIADIIYLEPYQIEHLEYKKWGRRDIQRAKEINSFLKNNRDKCIAALKTVHSFKKLKLILHNGKFDAKFAMKYGIPYKNFWFDTMMADSLIDENLGHSLNIAMERRGINYGPYDTKLWKYINKGEKNKKSYQFVPPPLLEKYLGVDVCGDYRLFHKQYKELKEEGLLEHLIKRKMRTVRNVTRTEYIGFKADKEEILTASDKISGLMVEAQKELDNITGIKDFNANSSDQICNYMLDQNYPFERYNVKRTKKGYKTDKEAMAKFVKVKKYSKFPLAVGTFKQLSKLKGTYIDGKDSLGGMVQFLDQNNRIHTSYNLHSPKTSREASKSPSVQVWPRPIKNLINIRNFVIPTNNNWNLFEADYSALEIYIAAHLSNDANLIEYLQKGMDLHCKNGCDLGRVLGIVPDWVTYEHMLVANGKSNLVDKKLIDGINKDIKDHPHVNLEEMRSRAKSISFGLNYGMDYRTFAKDFEIEEAEAKEMVEAYFSLYEGLKNWRDETIDKALNEGYLTLKSGRKRRLHSATNWLNNEESQGTWSRKTLEKSISRQAMNFPVQGGAHEVFEPALLRIENRIKKEELKARIMFRIHDGILGECPKEENHIVNQIIREEMPTTFNKGKWNELTLNVDIDFYKNEWYGEKIIV